MVCTVERMHVPHDLSVRNSGRPLSDCHVTCSQVKAVVVSYDKHFSFAKLLKACSYARNPDNIFIGSNEDPSLPTPNKEVVIPGEWVVAGQCGVRGQSFLGLIQASVGSEVSHFW